MPKDTILRAVTRGAGGADGASYEEIRYEGYGVGGAAVMVDCMTDNRTRTVADVRHVLRSEEHTSELQSLMRISYAVFCLKKKKSTNNTSKSLQSNHSTKT